MAKKLGNNMRLYIKGASTTYYEVGGQGNLAIARSQDFFSTGTKDDAPYDTQAPGLKKLTITLALIPDLPDANGFEKMEALDKSIATNMYQIREKPFATNDVIFECSMYTALGNTEMNQNAPTGVSVTLTAASPPTVDSLAASQSS